MKKRFVPLFLVFCPYAFSASPTPTGRKTKPFARALRRGDSGLQKPILQARSFRRGAFNQSWGIFITSLAAMRTPSLIMSAQSYWPRLGAINCSLQSFIETWGLSISSRVEPLTPLRPTKTPKQKRPPRKLQGDPLRDTRLGRAILLTNREIDSAAAVKLTTGAFDAMENDPRLSQAEAMRMSDQTIELASHPAPWAAFALIGDGGRKQKPFGAVPPPVRTGMALSRPRRAYATPNNRSRSPSNIWRIVRLPANSLARSATMFEVTDEA